MINISNEEIIVKPETIRSGSIIADNHILDFDRYGQVTKTKIRAKFKKDNECNIVITRAGGINYLKKTIKAINRLLDACSLFSNIYCNRKIISKDIIKFAIICEDKTAVLVNPLSQETGTSFKIFPQETNIENIRDFLKKDSDVSLHDELITNAKDFLLIENYRMACIEIQTGVEHCMLYYLRKKLQKINESNQYIENISKARLEEWTKEITKIDNSITSGKTWSDWKSLCYEIRKKVIHQSYFPNANETLKSIQSGEKLIKLFIDRL